MRSLIKPLIRSNFRSTIKDALQPAIDYVARLNGDGQYWQLSEPINLASSDIVEIDFIGGVVSNGFAAFIGTTNFAIRFDVDTTASFLREQGLGATLNGEAVSSGSTQIPVSGINKASLLASSSGALEQIASIADTRLMNLPIFNFRVIRNGIITNEIPLTNKAQGATQLPTVGNVSATMVGYTPDVWEEVKKLWYNKATGLVDCSYGLIECNEELIACL